MDLWGCFSLPVLQECADAEESSLCIGTAQEFAPSVYRTARAEVISLCSHEHLSASCSDLWKHRPLWLQLRPLRTLQVLSLKAVGRIFHVWHSREDPDGCVHLLCKKIISFQGNYNTKCLQTRLITVWAQRKEMLAAFDLSRLKGSEMDTDLLHWAQMQQGLSHREVVGLLGSQTLSLIFPTSSSSFQPCRQDTCSPGCYFRTHGLQLTVGVVARNHTDLFIPLCFNLIFMQRKFLLQGTCCTCIHNGASLPAWSVWSSVWCYRLCTYKGLSSFKFLFL